MNVYKNLTNDIEQLTDLEEVFYYIYKNNINIMNLPSPLPFDLLNLIKKSSSVSEDFWNIRNSFLDPDLNEKGFFKLASDIDVNIHPRYLPSDNHTHEFYEIQYVYSGAFSQTILDTNVFLKKGDICFIAPNTPHKLWVKNHDTIVINILVRTSTFRTTFINLMGKNDIISDFFTKSIYKIGASPYILCKTNAEDKLQYIIESLLNECAMPRKFSERYLKTMLELFFIEILRLHEFHFSVGESTENVENESILAIMRYIQNNFKTVTLPDVAHFFDYSEAYLSRMIKKFSGKNFSEIIKTIKIQYSANLLIENKMTIPDIVNEIGYTDISHFYRVFKKNYGVTPIQYRREQLKYKEPSF